MQKIAWDLVDHYYTLGTAFNEPVIFLSAIHFLCIEQALQVYSSKQYFRYINIGTLTTYMYSAFVSYMQVNIWTLILISVSVSTKTSFCLMFLGKYWLTLRICIQSTFCISGLVSFVYGY